MIAYEDAGRAADWLCRAFGFRERTSQRYEEEGVVSHAELEAGAGLIMLATPTPTYQSPAHHRAECAAAARWQDVPYVVDGVLVEVGNVDDHHRQAVASGALILSEPEDSPDGRRYRAEDPEGHRWMFIEGRST